MSDPNLGAECAHRLARMPFILMSDPVRSRRRWMPPCRAAHDAWSARRSDGLARAGGKLALQKVGCVVKCCGTSGATLACRGPTFCCLMHHYG